MDFRRCPVLSTLEGYAPNVVVYCVVSSLNFSLIFHYSSVNYVRKLSKYIALSKVVTFCEFSIYFPLHALKYRRSTEVKVLCYKSEGRWFDPSWCHWNFSLT